MNKKIIVISFLTLLGFGGLVFYLASQETIQETVSPAVTQAPLSSASFSFEAPKTTLKVGQAVPVALKFKVENEPGNKGIIGLKAVLTVNHPEILELTPVDIKETLPSPWQYLRKEISKDGKINIEAVYLQPGEKGYLLDKEETLAILNFLGKQDGRIELRLDSQKSKIITKEGNLEIPLPLRVYSNYEVIK